MKYNHTIGAMAPQIASTISALGVKEGAKIKDLTNDIVLEMLEFPESRKQDIKDKFSFEAVAAKLTKQRVFDYYRRQSDTKEHLQEYYHIPRDRADENDFSKLQSDYISEVLKSMKKMIDPKQSFTEKGQQKLDDLFEEIKSCPEEKLFFYAEKYKKCYQKIKKNNKRQEPLEKVLARDKNKDL